MERIDRTVFISYRRTNAPWVLAVFQNLTHHGYDVFFDYTGLASGDFERVITENIAGRAHFIVLLTPSALERCSEPGDWLRREIEIALETRRNIVPLMLEGFDFGSPSIASQLTGELANLRRYSSLRVPVDFFMEAMTRLRDKYLNVTLDAVVHPASESAQEIARQDQASASSAPLVAENELKAQQWFEQGFNARDEDEQIRCYTEAIRLKPDYVSAYNNRGNARKRKDDLDGALEDFSEAIRLNPNSVKTYNNRGNTRRRIGDLHGALQDFNEAIRLDPTYAPAYTERGNARVCKGDLEHAFNDFAEAIRLDPNHAPAYSGRGNARGQRGDLDGALEDLNEALRRNPDDAFANINRGNARCLKGDLEGALRDIEKAIRVKPDFAEAHESRGWINLAIGNVAGALQDFNEAIRLDPEYAISYISRAEARARTGDHAGAQQDLEEASRRNVTIRPRWV